MSAPTSDIRQALLDQLDAMRTEILQRLRHADAGLTLASGGHDASDRAEESESERQDEVDRDIDEAAGHILGEIEAARARVVEGTYGTCVDCGQPIPRERLIAHPAAIRCVSCQGRIEGADATRVKLVGRYAG